MASLDQLTGRGVAAGGRIVVTAQSGQLVRAQLDHHILQLRPSTLADELARAVNRALDDARAPIPAPDPRDIVDLEVVARDFTAIRDHAASLLEAIVSAIQDAAADLAREGKLPSEVGLPDAARLIEQMARVDDILSRPGPGSPRDTSTTLVRGYGQAGGLVHVFATPPGQVDDLSVEADAIRAGPEELGRLVVTAVNMALSSLEQCQREHRLAGAARRAELKKQFQEMNDAALAQIREFGSAASCMLGGISPGERASDRDVLPGGVTGHESGGRRGVG